MIETNDKRNHDLLSLTASEAKSYRSEAFGSFEECRSSLTLAFTELEKYVTNEWPIIGGTRDDSELTLDQIKIRNDERMEAVYSTLLTLIEGFDYIQPNIPFDLINSFNGIDYLLDIFDAELQPNLINALFSCFSYLLINKDVEKILESGKFMENFKLYVNNENFHYSSVPIVLHIFRQFLPVSADFRKYFEEETSNVTFILSLKNLLFSKYNEEAEKELNGKSSVPAYNEERVITTNDLFICDQEIANIFDIIFMYYPDSFLLDSALGELPALLSINNPFNQYHYVHGLRVLALKSEEMKHKIVTNGIYSLVQSLITQVHVIGQQVFVEIFIFMCVVCHQNPEMCNEVFVSSFFNSIVESLQSCNTVDTDLFLYNLAILVQETPEVSANLVSSGMFDLLLEFASGTTFYRKIESLMVLVAILKSSPDPEVLGAVVDTRVFEAFEIFTDIEDGPTQREFVFSMLCFMDTAERIGHTEWLYQLASMEYLEDFFDEYSGAFAYEVPELTATFQERLEKYIVYLP